MKHGLECFARLMRILLGRGSLADRKMECAGCTFATVELCVLGVDLTLSSAGFTCQPSVDKAKKWSAIAQQAVQGQHLAPGLASKLAGKLSWGCSQMFNRRVGTCE